jgi:hypothetical protein
MHAGYLVQSRLPLVLHRVIPAGVISLHNIGMIEAAVIGSLIATYVLGMPMRTYPELLIPMAVGAGLYHVAPP